MIILINLLLSLRVSQSLTVESLFYTDPKHRIMESRTTKTRREAILDMRLRRLVESLEYSELSQMKTGKGRLHSFVSGLLLSSAILEEIRQVTRVNVYVSWGQILNEKGELSKEIDIMIYFRRKPLYEWKNIGYAIISKQDVLSIFEVKRNFQSYLSHEKECEQLSKFAKKIFLIIYHNPNTIDGMKRRNVEV